MFTADVSDYLDDFKESLVESGENLIDAAVDIAVDQFLDALGIDDVNNNYMSLHCYHVEIVEQKIG